MNDLLRAKAVFEEKNYTCVLCKGETLLTATASGVAPLLDWIGAGADLRGFSAADKIVGKAAAMLFVYAGIREVYAPVMSRTAIDVFDRYGVRHTQDTVCPQIVNRSGTGPCPMELAVAQIATPAGALAAIREKREKMQRKKLGFGLMRLPLTDANDASSVDLPQVEKMVDLFLERGFTYFDTAYMYHQFKSELVAREALVRRYPRDAFTLTSKLPVSFLKSKADMERIFSEQLEKCGVEFFDYYLLHDLGASHYEIAKRFDSFAFVQEQKEKGKVKKTGFSYHDDAELLDEILTAHPEVDVVQLQINYLDWENESIQSRKCYETARKHGKEIIVMEPVKGGTLANVPPAAEKLFRRHSPESSVASFAIRFAASLEGVLVVLSGMSNLEQLSDNTAFMGRFVPLDAEEKAIIEKTVEIIHHAITIPCTACEYCTVKCPQNIPIPKYFALYNAELQALNKGFSTQSGYYANLARTFGKASDCIACRQCEAQCPQHLPVVEHLRQVAATFE